MLKIKDDVNMEDLKKFGFKPRYNSDTGELEEMYRIRGDREGTTIKYEDNFNGKYKHRDFFHILNRDRSIYRHGYVKLTSEDYEILYDLIQAGLVEKVLGRGSDF